MTLTKLPFWIVGLASTAVALVVFTFVIDRGRLSGPGISLALSVGALVWVARLLFEAARSLVHSGRAAEQTEAVAASGRRRKELEREYYILKRALKELELDHSMGKVSADDYSEIRTRYRERAVRLLRQLDQGESYRAQIEADLKARRQARGLPAPVAAPAPAPTTATDTTEPAAASEAPAEAPAPTAPAPAAPAPVGLCGSCSVQNDADAVFCKKCGHKLAAA